MKNELFSSESNLSRLGKYYMKKNIYLLNRKDYISNIKKILSSRHLKDENIFDNINNSISNYEKKSIFDIDYENNHDKILEKQMKKYLEHKDKYKFHSSQTQLLSKKQKHPVEEHKLLLFSIENFNIEKSKKNKNNNSFYKTLGRYSNVKTKQNDKKDIENKICSRILKAKKRDEILFKKNNQSNKEKKGKFEKKLFKKKLSFIESDNSSERNIQIKNKIIQNKNIVNSEIKNICSLENLKHIKTGVDFKRMLSRTKKMKFNSNEINSAYNPLTPKYNLVHPKIIINFMYKEQTSRKKDFIPKYRKNNYEFFFDLNKVYNKYNNHKEAPSFSLEKIPGREPYNLNKKDKSKMEKEKFDKNRINNELNEKINDIMKLKIDKFINFEKLQKEEKISNNILENAFQEILKKIILNKEKKNNNDVRLYKAMCGNKINNNYIKLLKVFSEYKFLIDLNSKGNYKIK